MERRIALLAAVILLTVCGVAAQSPAKSTAKADPWAGLRFLLGSWSAKTTGGMAQAQASAGYAFRLELRDHVLARHSRSGACNAPDDFDCQHSDLLYIYPSGNGVGAPSHLLRQRGPRHSL
jgi:hypothetical protein